MPPRTHLLCSRTAVPILGHPLADSKPKTDSSADSPQPLRSLPILTPRCCDAVLRDGAEAVVSPKPSCRSALCDPRRAVRNKPAAAAAGVDVSADFVEFSEISANRVLSTGRRGAAMKARAGRTIRWTRNDAKATDVQNSLATDETPCGLWPQTSGRKQVASNSRGKARLRASGSWCFIGGKKTESNSPRVNHALQIPRTRTTRGVTLCTSGGSFFGRVLSRRRVDPVRAIRRRCGPGGRCPGR